MNSVHRTIWFIPENNLWTDERIQCVKVHNGIMMPLNRQVVAECIDNIDDWLWKHLVYKS